MPTTTLAPLPDTARPPGRARRALAVLVALVLGVGAPLAVVAPAHADTIATVDFDDLSGWTVNFWSASGGNAIASRGPGGGGSISTTANFSGFENIEVSIRYRVENLAAGHVFFFNYNPGGTPFTPLNRTTDTAGFVTETYPLDASVNNDASVTLNFGNVTPSPDPMPIIEVDSMTITGDPIDTTDPTITVVGPADGSTIPIPASTDYEVEVADNATAAGDIDVEYSFHYDGDSFTETPTVGVGGARSATIAPNIFDVQFGLVQGEVFEWRITATDDESNVGSTSVFLVFGDPEGPELTVTSLDDGVRGTAYSMAISSYGTPPITYGALNLPDGLTISPSTGTISGTPTEAGTFSVTITATNDVDSDDVTLDLFIADPPTITTTTLVDGLVGTPYTASIAATGDPTLAYSATGLPPGITLDPSTGELSGTPTASGSYTPEFTVTNDSGSDVETISIDIDEAPSITSGSPPSGVVGSAYSHTVTAGGSPAATFSVTGSLPPGLSLDPTSGLIDGSPTTAGSFTFTIIATNGVGADDTAEYTVEIEPAPAAPAFTNGIADDGVVGESYSFEFTATGYPAATFSVSGGSLPPGLDLDETTGDLTGAPTAAGVFTFTVEASNGVGSPATLPVSIEVLEAPEIGTALPPTATVGVPYSFMIPVTGTAPFFFTLVIGALPAGLELNETTGEISGTPTETSTTSALIAVSNDTRIEDSVEFVFVVSPAAEPEPEAGDLAATLPVTGADPAGAAAIALLLITLGAVVRLSRRTA